MSLYEIIKKVKTNEQTNVFNRNLTVAARKNRYLSRVALELSPICNFTCPFCYARKTPSEMEMEGIEVLRFPFWRDILDQLSEMGVIYIGFTGGECMLHPDFVSIYEYAYKKGFLIYMLSNGSCLTDEITEMFKKHPPLGINITVYGGSSDTYQRICGNAAFYDVVKNNLYKLTAAQVPFSVQMTVSKDNIHDVNAVYVLSKKLQVRFNCDNTIFCMERCTKDIQTANHVDNMQFHEIKQHVLFSAKDQSSAAYLVPRKSNNLMGVGCSAGRCNAFINHTGMMQLCVAFQGIQFSVNQYSVKECWEKIVQAGDQIPQIPECNGCIHWGRCVHCFGAHYYDTGSFTTPSPRLCFKKLHSEEAARIEAYYAEHGELPPYEY